MKTKISVIASILVLSIITILSCSKNNSSNVDIADATANQQMISSQNSLSVRPIFRLRWSGGQSDGGRCVGGRCGVCPGVV